MSLSQEMSLWDKAELRVQGAQDDKSTTMLPSGRKVNLTLYPQKRVVMPVKPQKDLSKGEASFAGLAELEVKKEGLYRIALGSKVWLDLIEEGGPEAGLARSVPAVNSEMQTGCKKIFKALEYKLSAGKKYFLQISSSREPGVQIMTRFAEETNGR